MSYLKSFFHTIFVKRRKRSRIRSYVRGYIYLKKTNQIDKIANIKRILSDHKLSISSIKTPFYSLSGLVPESQHEISIRQYLLLRVGSHALNRALLLALSKKNGKVIYYLPKEWREILRRNGFEVAELRSAVLWNFYILLLSFYGLYIYFREIYRSLVNLKNKKRVLQPYVYFHNFVFRSFVWSFESRALLS